MASKVAAHPYYPKDMKLDGYVPNSKSEVELLTMFFGALTVCLIGLWIVMAFRQHLRGRLTLKIKISWFFMCGLIHTILEGYFAVYFKTLKGENTFLAELWKEYGKGDSRYIIGDTFAVCMEAITAAIDGPMALIATYAFLANTSYRYVAQLVLSLLQIYGDVLYFATEWKDGFIHGPMGHPLYFWFYVVVLNSFWIIVPFLCIVEAWNELTKSQSALDKKQSNNGRKQK